MRLRIGIVLLVALTLGACAAGTASGGGGGGGGGRATPGARTGGNASAELAGLAEGEPIANNTQTREAERQLNLALIQQADAQRAAYQAALNSAQQAITADARNPLPFLQKGKALIGLQQWAAADSALKKAEELRPVYLLEVRDAREKAWYDIYREGGAFLEATPPNYAGAVPVFENANLIYDRRPEIMVILGQLHFQLGNFEKSIENAKRGLTIMQSDRINEMDSVTAGIWRDQLQDIPPLLAQAYLNLQRYDEAVATLRPLLDANPTNKDYARTQASIFAKMTPPQQDSARAVLQRYARAAGSNLSAEDHFVMGMTFYEMSDYPAAVTSFNSVLTAAPNNRDAVEWKTRALNEIAQDQASGGGTITAETRTALIASGEQWMKLDPNSNYPYILLANHVNATGDATRAQQLVAQLSDLPFVTGNMEVRPGRGNVTVFVDITNKKLTPGQQLTLRFTFFGPGNANLGTKDATVTLPAVDATALMQADFDTTQTVEGYSYTVVTR